MREVRIGAGQRNNRLAKNDTIALQIVAAQTGDRPDPRSRLSLSAAMIAPKAVRGADGFPASRKTSGCAASKRLLAGSM